MTPAQPYKKLSDRLLGLLRSRVQSQQDDDVVDYLDKIFPLLELNAADFHQTVDTRFDYPIEEFLEYFDIQFLEACYVRIFKREIDPSGLEDGLRSMRQEKCSRILMIGRLRYSEEGKRHGVTIHGLRLHYFAARLRRLPVIGRVFSLASGLGRISRIDIEGELLAQQVSAFDDSLRQTASTVAQVLEHATIVHPEVTYTGAPSRDGDVFAVPICDDAARDADRSPLSTPSFLLLGLQREKFVDAAFQAALARHPTEEELTLTLADLDSRERSKLRVLGDLLCADGSVGSINDIPGLRAALRWERVYALPVIGVCVRTLRGLILLPRVEQVLNDQSREISHSCAQLSEYQQMLQSHYNDSVKRLRMEVLQALDVQAGDADIVEQGKD